MLLWATQKFVRWSMSSPQTFTVEARRAIGLAQRSSLLHLGMLSPSVQKLPCLADSGVRNWLCNSYFSSFQRHQSSLTVWWLTPCGTPAADKSEHRLHLILSEPKVSKQGYARGWGILSTCTVTHTPAFPKSQPPSPSAGDTGRTITSAAVHGGGHAAACACDSACLFPG